ncbi:MAG: hypothetical protein JJE01_08505 [Gemmatimonadetes bacterium]|nr:hypothetical protein [Gemmatimonadota bacterium]
MRSTQKSGIHMPTKVLGLFAAVLALAQPAVAQNQARSTADADVPAARPEDVESVDAILNAVYDVISGPAGETRDWDRMRSLFLPEARLIPSGKAQDGSTRYLVWSLEEYISSAGGQLEENGFFEQEAFRVEERFGNIAHVFSTYESFHTVEEMEAGAHFVRGINSFQLLFDGERWWVVQIYWQAETPDQPIPDRYLDAG